MKFVVMIRTETKPSVKFKFDKLIQTSMALDLVYKDSGIEQTWNFAHPSNKKNTGPLPNFKMMIKGNSYQMLLNHLSHTITQIGGGDKWAQFEEKLLSKLNLLLEVP